MSRVYEALSKAQGQHTADAAELASAVKPPPARRLPPQGEPVTTEIPSPKHPIPTPRSIDLRDDHPVAYPFPTGIPGREVSPCPRSVDEGSVPSLVVAREEQG